MNNVPMKSFKEIIHGGGVAVMRTDTLYGLVCDAHNQSALDRIYDIKQRNRAKPCIILVAYFNQIRDFGIEINSSLENILSSYWPGKVSIILPTHDGRVDTHYIHRGTGGIAFRIPDDESLRNILADVGPLAAPSANPEGKTPAKNIHEARDYFGDQVDYYLDAGDVVDTQPSKVIKIINSLDIEVLRG